MRKSLQSLILFIILTNLSLAQDLKIKSEINKEKLYSSTSQVYANNDYTLKNQKNIIVKNNISKPKNKYLKAKMGDFEFDIKNSDINTNKNEYGSGFFKDRFIIVSSKKIGAIGGRKDPRTGEHHTQLFCAEIKENGDLDKLVMYSRILNTSQNEGTITFSPDEKTIFFTRNKFSENGNFQLFKAKDFDGLGQWRGEEELPFSSKDHSIEDVYVSDNGKELYFSSNMKGGFGGYDLYVVEINDDGSYSKPKNLGKDINTELNERYPFIDSNENHIYFSSNSYNTLGGLDVFRSEKTNSGYKNVINLGPNINSDSDDFAFFIKDKNIGYYSSNKKIGIGGSDIYKITLKNTNKKIIKGNVRDALSLEVIPGTSVELIDQNGNIIDNILTNENGEFSFKAPPFQIYTLKANHDGYETNSTERHIDSAKDIEYYTNINIIKKELENKSIKESIYFTFNSKDLNTESERAITNILNNIERPIKKIKLVGHTDYFGSDKFNYKLGLERANSVLNVINKNKNIKPETVVISEGEKMPIIECNKCSSKKVKENRRVEVYIEY